ncbi:hypothetical protein RvY_10019 [Ramazzottius varieornatus]|uniref:Uncharacterized protein n=1 Tax=Ramazzottius varieornatus TaxID=947166 RepID=A0A1D1VBD5_RAMVA|nr:hypothetical protein RvY_10019 [Ramazzottius varieornatus]
MSDLPNKSFDAVPVSPAHTDESGYGSPRGFFCPPNTRFFPSTGDADFWLTTSDEEQDNLSVDPDFSHIMMLADEDRSRLQPEVKLDLQLSVTVRSKSPLLFGPSRASNFPFDACIWAGSSLTMRRHLLSRPSLSLFWENFRTQAADHSLEELDAQRENSFHSDAIDGEAPDMGPSPHKAVHLNRAHEDEPFSDDGASSTASHSPDMFRDEEASWDLPDIVTSGLRPRRKRTLSEADATRMKKLEYRIACRLAQIGDEFDLQMFQTTDAVDGQGRNVLGRIGSSSSAVVTRFWHYITRQGGAPPVESSRHRSHSTAD